jgi:hypothetical protein
MSNLKNIIYLILALLIIIMAIFINFSSDLSYYKIVPVSLQASIDIFPNEYMEKVAAVWFCVSPYSLESSSKKFILRKNKTPNNKWIFLISLSQTKYSWKNDVFKMALHSENETVCDGAIQAIALAGDAGLSQYLLDKWSEDNYVVVEKNDKFMRYIELGEAFLVMKDKAIIETLKKDFVANNNKAPYAAVVLLGLTGEKQYNEYLGRSLKTAQALVRGRLIVFLRDLIDIRSVKLLGIALNDKDPRIRAIARKNISYLNEMLSSHKTLKEVFGIKGD